MRIEELTNFKSGFVSIIGPPNAGKSTLINLILKTHLSIISSRPQTTRNNVAGIYTDVKKGVQIIFLDTPGILKKNKSLLDDNLMESVIKSLGNSDIILFMLPTNESLLNYQGFLEKVKDKKVLILLNKIDINDRDLSEEEKQLNYDYLKISALKDKNTNMLIERIIPLLTDHHQYYPEDYLSDRNERFFVKEYVRETILDLIKDEIPHQIFVDVVLILRI